MSASSKPASPPEAPSEEGPEDFDVELSTPLADLPRVPTALSSFLPAGGGRGGEGGGSGGGGSGGRGAGSEKGPGSGSRARHARTLSLAWGCKWPEDGNIDVNDAQVLLQLDLDATGKPLVIHVLRRTAANFEKAARACALRQRFQSARDDSGAPIPGSTAPILVHFSR